MNQMQAGLPNQINKSPSGFVVGDTILSPEVGSFFYRNGNSEIWLKHGVVLAAAGYPQAKLVEHLKAHGLSGTQSISTSSTYGEFATDGNGKWVFAYSDFTNVLVSVDNGITWSTVVHNCGLQVTSVTWSQSLGLFIGGGNNGSTFSFCTQTAAAVASAWTARAGSGITSGISATTLVRAGPNEVIATCSGSGSGTGQVSYSVNGTSWAPKNFTLGMGGSLDSGISLVNCGGSNWFYHRASNGQRSSDGGNTWVDVTVPSTSCFSSVFAFNKLFLLDQQGNLWTSPLGATGTFTSIGAPLTANRLRRLYFNGTRLYATLLNYSGTQHMSAFAWSLDGLLWQVRGLVKSWSAEGALGVFADRICFIPIGGAGCSYSFFSDPDYVGVPWVTSTSNNSLSTGALPMFYSKIKG